LKLGGKLTLIRGSTRCGYAFSTEILLLRLIHRRVRQHSLVILDPSEIAGIKPSTAPVAFEEVLALVKWWSADALADPVPRGLGRPLA
jgi:hypothetical protein